MACGKDSMQTSYPGVVNGNWAAISRATVTGSYLQLGNFSSSFEYHSPGSDSLAVIFNNGQFTFSYLSNEIDGFYFYTVSVPIAPVVNPVQLYKSNGSYQVINDSKVIIQPDTSAFLKYCTGSIYDSLIVSANDTLHFKKYGSDSMTITHDDITSNQIAIHTNIGFRKLK